MQSNLPLQQQITSGEDSSKGNKARLLLSFSYWSLLIIILAMISYYRTSNFTKDIAIAEARSYFLKDRNIRMWSTSHGGVYVPTDKRTPPNPYLSHIPTRDIVKPDGTQLTLMNPAYMIRQIYDLQAKEYGILGHITSLRPLRPENKPDDWERYALTEFEKGIPEMQDFTVISSTPHLRLMKPLITREGCLKCHATQGYKVGDIRGGISITIPLTSLLERQHSNLREQYILLGLLWILGALFILFQEKRVLRSQELSSNAQKKLASTLSEHAAITATVSDVMYMFDQQGVFKWWNKSLETVTGLSAEQIQTTHALDLFPEEDQEKVKTAVKQAFTEHPSAVEALLKTASGLQHYLFSCTRLELDSTLYLVGSGHNLTSQKEVEQELTEARDVAESANRAKSVFLSSMSHELRTPLNAILGYTQIFAGDSNLTPQQVSGIKTMYQSGQHLLLLINDILDLSKIESGKMELSLTEIRLPEFLQGITDIIRVRSDEKGLSFYYTAVTDLPAIVEADELRLRQVLLNLLANAVKFTDVGHCTLSVSATPINLHSTELTIRVEDSGPGIPQEMQELIFAPFQQTGEYLKYAEGSGLGLAISRKLVNLMGGHLQVASPVPNRSGGKKSGCCFSFSILLSVPERPEHSILSIQPQAAPLPPVVKTIEAPSNTILSHFSTLLEGGDIEGIKTAARDLTEHNSGKYKVFADHLYQLAEDLNLAKIRSFIDTYSKNNR